MKTRTNLFELAEDRLELLLTDTDTGVGAANVDRQKKEKRGKETGRREGHGEETRERQAEGSGRVGDAERVRRRGGKGSASVRKGQRAEDEHRDANANGICLLFESVLEVHVNRFSPFDRYRSLLRVLDRIRRDIRDDLSKLRSVTEKNGRGTGRLLDDRELDASSLRLLTMNAESIVDGVGDIERVGEVKVLTLLRASEVCVGRNEREGKARRNERKLTEEIVDDVDEGLRSRVRALQILPNLAFHRTVEREFEVAVGGSKVSEEAGKIEVAG